MGKRITRHTQNRQRDGQGEHGKALEPQIPLERQIRHQAARYGPQDADEGIGAQQLARPSHARKPGNLSTARCHDSFLLFFAFLAIVFRLADQMGKLASPPADIPQKGLQLLREIGHRIVALPLFGIERIEDHLVGFLIQLGAADRGQQDIRLLDRRLRSNQIICQEGIVPREHFVDHRSQRPFVATRIERLQAHLLERHVADGSTRRLGKARRAGKLGKAEVRHLHLALMVDQDVAGFDVQVEHLIGMGDIERMGHACKHRCNHIQGDVVLEFGKQVRQGDTIHIFHDEVGEAVFHAEVQHASDIGVLEHRGGPGLGKSRDAVQVVGRHIICALHHRGGLLVELQALDRDTTLQPGVPGQGYFCETARADPADRPIAPEDELFGHMRPPIGMTARTRCVLRFREGLRQPRP